MKRLVLSALLVLSMSAAADECRDMCGNLSKKMARACEPKPDPEANPKYPKSAKAEAKKKAGCLERLKEMTDECLQQCGKGGDDAE